MYVHTYYGVVTLPFWSLRRLPLHRQTGTSSLTSGAVILSLYFSKVQLLPLKLILGVSWVCLGENKTSTLLHLANISCLAQGPIYLLPQYASREHAGLWLYFSFSFLCHLNFPRCSLDAVVRGPGLQWQGWEVAMIHKQRTVTRFLTLCQPEFLRPW